MKRISWLRPMAALAAAALLVVGFDYATFASTGNSLILGQFNRSNDTTSLTNAGAGPALRLRSAGGQSPALAVSNSKKILKLNADLLDGRNAGRLATRAVTYSAGARGQVYDGTALWDLPLNPGVYEVSFRAGVLPMAGTSTEPNGVICGLANLNTIGSRTHVYTAQTDNYTGGGFPAFLSGAETVRITPQARPGFVCTTESGSFSFFSAAKASVTRINSRRQQVAHPATMKLSPRRVFLSAPH